MNPFSLGRIFTTVKKQKMVYMLWGKNIPTDIYKYICQREHFAVSNSLNITYNKAEQTLDLSIMREPNFGTLSLYFSVCVRAYCLQNTS